MVTVHFSEGVAQPPQSAALRRGGPTKQASNSSLSESLTIRPNRRRRKGIKSALLSRYCPCGKHHAHQETDDSDQARRRLVRPAATTSAGSHPVQETLSLAPVNRQEQWQIAKSFRLLQYATDLETALDVGVRSDDWTKTDTTGGVALVDQLLEAYGSNVLPRPELESYFTLWLGAFKDIMMILLVVAMIVLFAVGDVVAASAILVIVLIATNIGAYTEYTSNRAAAELGDVPGQTLVRVQRQWQRVNNTRLLPGMIIELQKGDIVPADAIILTHKGDCACSEAMLTGESEPVSKFPFWHPKDPETGHGHDDHDKNNNEDHEDQHEEDDAQKEAHRREDMTRLFMGTEFSSGECRAVIVETGARTKMGQIFQSMADNDPDPSPLQVMIDRLILVLALLSICVSVINAAVCIPTGNGVEPNSSDPVALTCVLNSVALTVAAVPENLPVALVIALAAIIKNLARRDVIVKSLPAGEELSRLNYVFSDKTGTLTENKMTARAVVTLDGHVEIKQASNGTNASDINGSIKENQFVSPKESTPLEEPAYALTDQIRALAALAQDEIRSNPTGDACREAYRADDEDPARVVPAKRFLLEAATSKTKMARVGITVTMAENSQQQPYLVKVGSDWVLRGVTKQATLQTDLSRLRQDTLQDFDSEACRTAIDTWAKDGYRVICVVVKAVETLPEDIVEGQVGDFGDGFVFLGCLAIQDPPREDVTENVGIIRNAGVVVSMITGDNPITGLSIARQVGLADEHTEEDMKMCLINAYELFHGMEEEEAKREIHKRLHYSMTHKKGLIIGRVSPFQKKWFVDVAKAMGLVVAMTGDGANDSPALKSANVGIAMGTGSDIAKAAGDMILVNPSFSGIVEAIRAGRLGFDNILKFLLFLLGTNISEVIIYLTLTFANIVIVLDALNLLVLNLLTDGFPAIALSLEKAEGDLMKRDPLRRDTSVLNKFTYLSITITNAALLGSYLVVILLGNKWYLGDITGQDTSAVEDYDSGLERVRMMFILLINISELLLGFSHRSPDRSVFSIGFFSGKWMNFAALSSMAIIILMTHLPGLKGIMRTDYLDAKSYLLVAAMSFFPFIVHEVGKVVIFQRLNFNVYALYKFHYVPHKDDEILKIAAMENGADSEEPENNPS